MDNSQHFSAEQTGEEKNSPDQAIYPPKPAAEEKKGNVWLRSLTSLVLYLAVGYYFFQGNLILLVILTGIVIFHELGHFIAMKMYNYKDLGIFLFHCSALMPAARREKCPRKNRRSFYWPAHCRESFSAWLCIYSIITVIRIPFMI